jgi:hypothetical protein
MGEIIAQNMLTDWNYQYAVIVASSWLSILYDNESFIIKNSVTTLIAELPASHEEYCSAELIS